MLEFERFVAVGAFEFPEPGALVVADHVTLETVHVGEILLTHAARLSTKHQSNRNTSK